MPGKHRIDNLENLSIYGFFHIATIGKWKEIVADQLARLASSGLYARTERLFVGIVGEEYALFQTHFSKVEVIHQSPNCEEFEFPTLEYLHNFCKNRDQNPCLVYYIHTKGVYRDTPATSDWRSYMEYFVVERYSTCVEALRTFDICGVNWQHVPWPHFSGNFWWARSTYVSSLQPLRELPSVKVGFDQGTRHQCERWVGSGENVKPASFHQSRLHHYLSLYPRCRYEGPDLGDALQPIRIAVIFDSSIRFDTTGIYCLRALQRLASVSHFLPSETELISSRAFDLFIYIDDGLNYPIPHHLKPNALWAIDTHYDPIRTIRRAAGLDFVFCAQREGVALLQANQIKCVGWLPLACDPEVHIKYEIEKSVDVCFVAHINTAERKRIVTLLQTQFANLFVGQKFFAEMAMMYSKSRIILNRSISNDLNMRVFEALSCGSLLITNALPHNGYDPLFIEGKHFVTYYDDADLLSKIRFYLSQPDESEKIAKRGREEVLASHTYIARMSTMLKTIGSQLFPEKRIPDVQPISSSEIRKTPFTSIVIPVFNQLAFTKQCVESIRDMTSEPIEIIVVDDGSIDGTPEYLRSCENVTVITNSVNQGFAFSINRGIKACRGNEIVILNNDTLVTKGWLRRMLNALYSAPTIGIVGPCTNEAPGPQRVSINPTTGAGISNTSETLGVLNAGWVEDVVLLAGFCLLIRRQVISSMGLFDEQYGIGTYDDYAYCASALSSGFRVVIARDAYVHHFGSVTLKSIGIDIEELLRRNRLIFESRWESTIRTLEDNLSRRRNTSIIIVTCNGLSFVKECIDSVRRCTTECYEIIIVDNASTDGTREYLRVLPNIRLIEHKENRGFPAAVNSGLAISSGDDILLLNSDVVVTHGWLTRLRSALYSSLHVGIVGPCTNEISGPQKIPVPYGTSTELEEFARYRSIVFRANYQPVPRLVGFCMLFRRTVYQCIGGLDERFGIGNFEDDDFCLRAANAGFELLIAQDCFVHHIGSATFRLNSIDHAELMRQNREKFILKWEGSDVAKDPSVGVTLLGRPNIPEKKSLLISLCMIVRDSSLTLERCLTSIQPWVDEMIVVDTGSTDDTVKIAEAAGANVSYFAWCDDFSAARNASLEKASCDWIFWMDADDTIDAENGRKLRELVRQPVAENTFGYVCQVHCPGQTAASGDGYATSTVVDHVKLFRNRRGLRFSGRIHEQLLPAIRELRGEVAWTDIFVVHSGADYSAVGRARKHERDLRILNKELASDPDHTFILFNVGMTLVDKGNFADALNYLCRSLQRASGTDSHLRKIYALIVQSYEGLGRDRAALETCLQGLGVCVGDPELTFRAGILFQRCGNCFEAEKCFRSLVGRERLAHFSSVDSGIFGVKAWHNLAILYERQHELQLAVDAWRHVVECDPSSLVGWLGWLDIAKKTSSVIALEEIVKSASSTIHANVVVPLVRAEQWHLRGEKDASICELETALLASDSIEILKGLSELSFVMGKWSKAEESLKLLSKRCPNDGAIFHNLALTLYSQNRMLEALAYIELSLKVRPGYEPSLVFLSHLRQAIELREKSKNCDKIYIGKTLIGDGLFMEPAIRELSKQLGRPVTVFVQGPVRSLFERNPFMSLLDVMTEAHTAENGWVELEPSFASKVSFSRKRHISEGFLFRLGLDSKDVETKPRLFEQGLEPNRRPNSINRSGRIALAPFSASCSIHTDGVANKTIGLAWWNELITLLPLPSFSLGANGEPDLYGCDNYRGKDLINVAYLLRDCDMLISGDTGIAILAGTLNCDIILLSSATPVWLTGPLTEGKLETLYSPAPPSWSHDAVIAAVGRLLST